MPLSVLFLATPSSVPEVSPNRLTSKTARSGALALGAAEQKYFSALPSALRKASISVDVRVFALVPQSDVLGVEHEIQAFEIPTKARPVVIRVLEGEGKSHFRLQIESGALHGFDSGKDTDAFAQIAFCLGALEAARRQNFRPHVVHAHGWQGAAAVLQLHRIRGLDANYALTRSLLTVHDGLDHGPRCPKVLDYFGLLDGAAQTLPEQVREIPMALGMVFADRLCATSRGAADDILAGNQQEALHGLIGLRIANESGKLTSIAHGLDPDATGPAKDLALKFAYDADSIEGRLLNKSALQQELELSKEAAATTIALDVAELQSPDEQLQRVLVQHERPYQFVILSADPALPVSGALPSRDLPAWLKPHRDEVRVVSATSDMWRRTLAGVDGYLFGRIHSSFDTRILEALQYGALPISIERGAAVDFVRDFDLSNDPNGFLASDDSGAALSFAVRRAGAVLSREGVAQRLIRTAMKPRRTWADVADETCALYTEMSFRRPSEVPDKLIRHLSEHPVRLGRRGNDTPAEHSEVPTKLDKVSILAPSKVVIADKDSEVPPLTPRAAPPTRDSERLHPEPKRKTLRPGADLPDQPNPAPAEQKGDAKTGGTLRPQVVLESGNWVLPSDSDE